MPDAPTAAALLRDVGLIADGPATWGSAVRAAGPGVFVVELTAPVPSAPIDLALVGKWLERVPDLRLDGVRPASKDLLHRLAAFWLPSQPVVYVGSTPGSVAGRVAAIVRTVPGDRKPAASGLWLHFLRSPADLRVWWAATDAPEEYEDALLDAFAVGVPAGDRVALPRPDAELGDAGDPAVLPWAVLRSPSGARKATGIANPLLPEVRAPEPPPVTRIVELPLAEADGARDEARRGRRPAPGRGVGRVASAAAYAAQGSPRKPPPEPVYVSPEGLERLQAELDGLLAERPGVIRRIATAREHGDLKENAEYHAAREEQGFLEGRIKALEAKLKVAVVVSPTERGARVELGSRVRVEVDGEESVIQVVGAAEATSREGRISSASPVGAALMGRRVGDAVSIVTPSGEIRYAVLGIE
jgi:transcription elongation factor GreA